MLFPCLHARCWDSPHGGVQIRLRPSCSADFTGAVSTSISSARAPIPSRLRRLAMNLPTSLTCNAAWYSITTTRSAQHESSSALRRLRECTESCSDSFQSAIGNPLGIATCGNASQALTKTIGIPLAHQCLHRTSPTRSQRPLLTTSKRGNAKERPGCPRPAPVRRRRSACTERQRGGSDRAPSPATLAAC